MDVAIGCTKYDPFIHPNTYLPLSTRLHLISNILMMNRKVMRLVADWGFGLQLTLEDLYSWCILRFSQASGLDFPGPSSALPQITLRRLPLPVGIVSPLLTFMFSSFFLSFLLSVISVFFFFLLVCFWVGCARPVQGL